MVEKNENDSKKSSDSTKYGDNQEPEFKGLMTPKTITIIFNIAIFFRNNTALDEEDIALLKSYGENQYSKNIKHTEEHIQTIIKRINEVSGIKESDTGLAQPALWDLAADKQILQNEQPLQVARCTKIINADTEDPKYIINVKQFAKFVVDLADSVAPTDIEEGMRVG